MNEAIGSVKQSFFKSYTDYPWMEEITKRESMESSQRAALPLHQIIFGFKHELDKCKENNREKLDYFANKISAFSVEKVDYYQSSLLTRCIEIFSRFRNLLIFGIFESSGELGLRLSNEFFKQTFSTSFSSPSSVLITPKKSKSRTKKGSTPVSQEISNEEAIEALANEKMRLYKKIVTTLEKVWIYPHSKKQFRFWITRLFSEILKDKKVVNWTQGDTKQIKENIYETVCELELDKEYAGVLTISDRPVVIIKKNISISFIEEVDPSTSTSKRKISAISYSDISDEESENSHEGNNQISSISCEFSVKKMTAERQYLICSISALGRKIEGRIPAIILLARRYLKWKAPKVT